MTSLSIPISFSSSSSYPSLVGEVSQALKCIWFAFTFSMEMEKRAKSVTWPVNDKEAWPQLEHPDMFEKLLCPGWRDVFRPYINSSCLSVAAEHKLASWFSVNSPTLALFSAASVFRGRWADTLMRTCHCWSCAKNTHPFSFWSQS